MLGRLQAGDRKHQVEWPPNLPVAVFNMKSSLASCHERHRVFDKDGSGSISRDELAQAADGMDL